MDVEYATLVRAPRESVYDAVATAKGLDGWFTEGAEVEARTEGRILFRWKDWGAERFTGEDGGRVLEARRPERFVFEWHPEGPEEPTTVEFTFEDDPEGTMVHVRDSGFKDPETALWCAAGWGEALTLLKFHLEHGVRY